MHAEGGSRVSSAWPKFRFLGGSILVFLALIVPVQSAYATFHLVSIREVYAGSSAHPESSFLELQMYKAGQNFVQNHGVTLYNSAGTPIGTFTFPADLPGEGKNQQTMLVGDDGVEAAFGVKPDLVNPGFNVPAAGGAACWDSLDCVSWGTFSGTTVPDSGVPADSAGIPDATAIVRRTSEGTCANLLDEADDTNDSDGDFADAPPAPQSYATVPAPVTCVAPLPTPVTVIDSKPAFSTNSTSATFAFHSSPAGAGFECRLDRLSYEDCDSGAITYAGPLSQATHSFRVRGSNANGVGAPTTYSWAVDLTAPTASITSHPADPSPGKTATFRYGSSEGGSKFECRLEPLEAVFTPCNTQPKVYSGLADGEYEFEVRATDAAGNVQPVATTFPWTVDNSLADSTPPETTIVSRPPDPSASPIAAFAYSSNEPGSTFQCKLDGESFNSCPASGISYSGLANGAHTFQVRAIDAANNTDPTPAGYSFTVALAAGLPIGPTSAGKPTPAKPNTAISKQGARTRDRTPTFRFTSSQTGASFQCKLDGGPFKACRSPFTTKALSYGTHVLQVRATASGVADPTPAKVGFKVVRK
jgi:hypothetical protein